jgi:hypothetical protein
MRGLRDAMIESTVNSSARDAGQITLPNGGHLYLRPVRRGPIGELFARLSLRTRYLLTCPL